MTRSFICAFLLVGIFVHGSMVTTVRGQERNRVQVDRVTTQQKALYIDRLLTHSVAARTIEKSNDATAQAKLEEARGLAREAQKDLDEARISEANDKLNRALRLVNSETQRLSKRSVEREHLSAGYQKRLHTVRTFLKAYERVALESSSDSIVAERTARLKSSIAEAREIANKGEFDKAISILDGAYREARGDIREMRAGKTLVRTLNFDTPEKEYRYEIGRNDSHMMLLKFALGEKKPPAVFLKRIDELREQAAMMRSQAQLRAEGQDYPAAIDELVRSTNTLLKAIRMTGLYIPG